MELEKAIKERRSIRSYQKRDVEESKIIEIIDAARWAPSAGNLQCVEYIVVKDPEKRRLLCKASYSQEHVEEAPVCIVVCCNMKKISRYGDRGFNLYSLQESGSAIQNLMLKAYELGLGTCWIGAFDEKSVKEILEIPDHVRPVALITLGYPDEKPESSRRDLKEIVFSEKYGKNIGSL